MKKTFYIACFFVLLAAGTANAHFQAIIPSTDIVTAEGGKDVSMDVLFFHPFEGHVMDMEKPIQFEVLLRGKKTSLLESLISVKKDGFSAFTSDYKIQRPGDHVFFVEPAPYWEPAEDCFIVHYTKVVVNAMGLEEGWDEEVGLKTEIVPLVRPYGLWTGNVFSGIVKLNGKSVPNAEIEVEYYNESGKIKAPADPFVTQVIKADENGVFNYAMPRAGWWGFAALSEDEKTMKGPDGNEKAIEIGAVMWVKVTDM
ncbi:DUF4198 domain-containing protein [bacterium]